MYSIGQTLLIAPLLLISHALPSLHLPAIAMSKPQLLTDPFLQLPTKNSVLVVWFTEFAGSQHIVQYGQNLEQKALATTTKLTRVREDQQSRIGEQREDGQVYAQPTKREIWRHEAKVTVAPNTRLPYRVKSYRNDGEAVSSDRFSLSPLPTTGQPLKILLTSDHQLKSMTPANLQKVTDVVGSVDAVFFAGDLVNVPDRASEWFDDNRGNAFFPSLQGRANFSLEKEGIITYTGSPIIQSAPLFPTIGNHEVMGRFSMKNSLGKQFNDPVPLNIARQRYSKIASQVNPLSDPALQQTWIKDNTFNVDTYKELFTLPTESPGGEKYYAITFGDIRLISLYITNIWRPPGLNPKSKGRYREQKKDLQDPDQWGYGQHIFEAIAPGSEQYKWLQTELERPEFQQAKYKIVMFHHPPHSLGDNAVPAFTDPVQTIDYSTDGQVQSVNYAYPIDADYLKQDVIPLLEANGVDLVFYGHTHLWNRFVSPKGLHFLESSNVGNTYGAYTATNGNRRSIPPEFKGLYAATDDPNGLEAVVPTISPLMDEAGQPQPYIASNEITVFSILDTQTGQVSSYRFDTRKPDSEAIKFDEFSLGRK